MASTISIYRDNDILFSHAKYANRFWSRTIGLLGRSHIKESEAIVLTPCNQIHTLGMRFSIDIVFLDEDHVVTKCVENLGPGKASRSGRARYVIEIAPGSIKKHQIAKAQKFLLKPAQ